MFKSILEIGESLSEESENLFPIESVPQGKKYAIKIIFDLNKRRLDVDLISELEGERGKRTASEYLWVGNAKGNTPQLMLTTDHYKYIFGSDKKRQQEHKLAIPALLKYIETQGLKGEVRTLYSYLSKIKSKFYSDENTSKKLLQKFKSALFQKGIINKPDESEISKEIGLFTVSVRKCGKLIDLAKEADYKKLLKRVILMRDARIAFGKCHICGRDGEVLTNPDYPKGSLLGIYVIDKLGFLSNISNDQESLLRTHSICLKCKEKLVLGINVIEKHLSSKIDNVSVLIIPSLVKIDQKSEMKQLLEYCKNAFNTANSYETYSQIENIEDELMGRRLFVLVNLVFGQGRQSQFIYHATIQNVPPSRLILIGEKSRELAGETAVFFEEERDKWFIGLSDVKRLLPLRKLGNKTVLKPFIELVNAMLTESPYPKEQILKFALLYAKVHHFGNYEGYDIKRVDRRQRDVEMCKGLLKYVLLLNLLVKLGVIEMEEGLFPSLEGVNKEEIKDIIDFCRKQGYNEWQTGLFLLGVLIGKIGVEQYNKGDTKKAILEKIDFNGMHVDKLKWLVNIILEGLKNYRLLEWNEEIYAQAKLIIDRNISNLKDPIANTFYVLSGYAYATLKAIKGGGKSGNK